MPYSNTEKIKKYFSIFTPSAIGMVLYVSIMLFIIVLHQFESIRQYLQLPSVHLLQTLMLWLEKFLNATIGESSTQTLIVGLFWAVVGLGVYIFLRGVARFLTELSEGYEERNYLWPRGVDRNRPLVEAAERTISRVVAFIGLLIIVFGPLAAVFSGPIWADFIGPNTLVQVLFWLPAGMLTLHLCVVLLRLSAMRQRLFD
ncbi:MAG TPA: hypothetical protein VK978_01220 [Candidatus Saccharimonadales bacterium]|nr:hypothetical protein [Candidatus Saccharimonadales bacterium]